ncbi:MAG: hypothetical protein GXO85_06670 [Chlorobi bacterium]|nr:hypothetical protein [Chlorobiota bacterium]
MKRLNIIFIVVMLGIYLPILAQQKALPIYTAATNSAACIIVVNAPSGTEGFNVYREAPGESDFTLLTKNPIVPFIDPGIVKTILKDDYEWVKKSLRANDDFEIVRRLQSDAGTSAVLSLASLNVARAAGRLFIDNKVKQNDTYKYKVDFIDFDGNVLSSVQRNIKISDTQPPIPDSVRCDPGDTKVKISWDFPPYKGDKDDITVGFNIYRNSEKGELQKVNKVLILRQEDIKFRTDISVQNNVSYTYFVKSVDCIGRESAPSNKVSAIPIDLTPPKYPEGLDALGEQGRILVSWKMNLELDLSHYDIYKSMEVLGTYARINKIPIPADQPFYYDTVYTGPTYYYKVKAVDMVGNESEFSNSISGQPADTIPPAPPSNITAIIEDQFVRLKWKAPTDLDLQGYYIYSRRSDQKFLRLVSLPLPSDSLEYFDTGYNQEGLWQGQTYYYGISAVDNYFNESEMSIMKIIIPDNDPPEPPVSSYASLNDNGYVEVTWQPSMSIDVANYRIFRTESSKEPMRIIETADSVYKAIDSTAKYGVSYGYQVAAVDNFRNESIKTKKVTVVPSDLTPPPAPESVSAIPIALGVRISWDPVAVNDLLGYNIYIAEVPNGIPTKLNNEPVKMTEYFDPTGKEGMYYTVSALDTSLHESKSQAIEARTKHGK